MKTLLTLAVSLIIVSCAYGPSPKFPDEVENYYALIIKGEPLPSDFQRRVSNVEQLAFDVSLMDEDSARCMHFKIVSKHPVKIKYVGEVFVKNCHLVGGFTPKDTQLVFNWIDDAWAWMETRKHCFKK